MHFPIWSVKKQRDVPLCGEPGFDLPKFFAQPDGVTCTHCKARLAQGIKRLAVFEESLKPAAEPS